jgi:DNA-binding transcriptional regulator PaaX
MSLVKDILRITAKYYPMGYGQLYEYLYDETTYGKKLNRNSLEATLSRMGKNGLLRNKNREWSITSDGRIFLEKKSVAVRKFFKRENVINNRGKQKNLIIIFDIPEKKKRYREWLRFELVGFGFTLVQKSVWLGPSLPREFVEYLSEIGLLKHIRFFRATEKDLI